LGSKNYCLATSLDFKTEVGNSFLLAGHWSKYGLCGPVFSEKMHFKRHFYFRSNLKMFASYIKVLSGPRVACGPDVAQAGLKRYFLMLFISKVQKFISFKNSDKNITLGRGMCHILYEWPLWQCVIKLST